MRFTTLLVGPGGLEPPTSSLSAKRSNRLSYGPSAPPGGDPGYPTAFRRLKPELVVGQRDVDPADQLGNDVVDERANGAERGDDDDIEHRDQDRS